MTKTNVSVNWGMIMGIQHRMARIAWVHLMGTMDRDQMATMDMNGLVKSGLDRSALCKAMQELVDMDLIRPRGQGWLTVWINPAAVRPYWREGKLLAKALHDFKNGIPRLSPEDGNLLLVSEEGGEE